LMLPPVSKGFRAPKERLIPLQGDSWCGGHPVGIDFRIVQLTGRSWVDKLVL
jgi:hypothetical protein